jgi:hypothetical protein
VAFISDEQLKAELSAVLHVIGQDMTSANWGPIVKTSNKAAYDAIQGALRGRGYTAAQILTWDRREEFNKHIGLYWCLVNGGVTSPHGDPIDPGDESVGGAVGYGTLDTTDDRYTRDTEW